MIIPDSRPLVTPRCSNGTAEQGLDAGRITSTVSAPVVPAGVDVSTKTL
ncbi:hypothetical protein K6U06_09455 [Acidiferrimicrobium sp. IK]|nr:hypothetical protein [Acidiferrimicrobium sp. IK]MCU4184583.1 hypothetical protein [Acidiferrimicrobium sp. IK]